MFVWCVCFFFCCGSGCIFMFFPWLVLVVVCSALFDGGLWDVFGALRFVWSLNKFVLSFFSGCLVVGSLFYNRYLPMLCCVHCVVIS